MVNGQIQTTEDPQYKEGYKLGVEASVPPTTLNQLLILI
jgi:hypothetical protein